jgi:hypothetical protein
MWERQRSRWGAGGRRCFAPASSLGICGLPHDLHCMNEADALTQKDVRLKAAPRDSELCLPLQLMLVINSSSSSSSTHETN